MRIQTQAFLDLLFDAAPHSQELNTKAAFAKAALDTLREMSFDSDSVKRHLSRRHLSALNLKLDFSFDGGCTREEQIAHSLKRHLFPHGGRKPKVFWIYFSTLPPVLKIFQFLELSTKAASAKAAFYTL